MSNPWVETPASDEQRKVNARRLSAMQVGGMMREVVAALVPDDLKGPLYRDREPTLRDYDDAIADLLRARDQIFFRTLASQCCSVCEDGGHTAEVCHHNPFVVAREAAAQRGAFRCFWCGYTAITEEQGRAHFGPEPDSPMQCLVVDALRWKFARSVLQAQVGGAQAGCYLISDPLPGGAEPWPIDPQEWIDVARGVKEAALL